MAAIRLVANDTLPYISLTLYNADNSTMNVQGATVVIQFRQAGTEPVLSVIPCTMPNGGGDGLVQFHFPNPVLNVPPGNYEGAVQITFASDVQTLWNTIPFVVRASF
jgi:hypothetical protein